MACTPSPPPSTPILPLLRVLTPNTLFLLPFLLPDHHKSTISSCGPCVSTACRDGGKDSTSRRKSAVALPPSVSDCTAVVTNRGVSWSRCSAPALALPSSRLRHICGNGEPQPLSLPCSRDVGLPCPSPRPNGAERSRSHCRCRIVAALPLPLTCD